MNTRLVIDKAGRVRPIRGTGPLGKEHGVWVFRTGQPLPASATDKILPQIRKERDLTNLGKGECKEGTIGVPDR
jgi:hypothetical protein